MRHRIAAWELAFVTPAGHGGRDRTPRALSQPLDRSRTLRGYERLGRLSTGRVCDDEVTGRCYGGTSMIMNCFRSWKRNAVSTNLRCVDRILSLVRTARAWEQCLIAWASPSRMPGGPATSDGADRWENCPSRIRNGSPPKWSRRKKLGQRRLYFAKTDGHSRLRLLTVTTRPTAHQPGLAPNRGPLRQVPYLRMAERRSTS